MPARYGETEEDTSGNKMKPLDTFVDRHGGRHGDALMPRAFCGRPHWAPQQSPGGVTVVASVLEARTDQ